MRHLLLFLGLVILTTVGCKSAPSSSDANSNPFEHALRASVNTAPAEPRMDKPFTVRAQLFDSSGGPVAGAKLSGELSMKGMDHGKTEFEFTEKGHGVYEGISKVEMSGEWNLQLTADHGSDRLQQDIAITVAD
jgi:nitrogen fixation protein FixH